MSENVTTTPRLFNAYVLREVTTASGHTYRQTGSGAYGVIEQAMAEARRQDGMEAAKAHHGYRVLGVQVRYCDGTGEVVELPLEVAA